MKITIEQPEPEEAQAMSKVSFASKRHWGYPEEWIDLWRELLTITPKKIRAREFWVGRLRNDILFVYSIRRETDEVYELEDCWMAPAFIGHGYGKILFAHLRARLRELGCSKLLILSDPHAEGFYLKMGAVRVGEQPSTPEGRKLPLMEYLVQ